jgi:hypothetical protein
MNPIRKLPGADENRRLKYVGRANWVMARLIVPHIRDRRQLRTLADDADRDIYAETVAAMGYDPLAR